MSNAYTSWSWEMYSRFKWGNTSVSLMKHCILRQECCSMALYVRMLCRDSVVITKAHNTVLESLRTTLMPEIFLWIHRFQDVVAQMLMLSSLPQVPSAIPVCSICLSVIIPDGPFLATSCFPCWTGKQVWLVQNGQDMVSFMVLIETAQSSPASTPKQYLSRGLHF